MKHNVYLSINQISKLDENITKIIHHLKRIGLLKQVTTSNTNYLEN